MAAALFALAGALIGALRAFGVELVRARVENRRLRQEALRLTCADFTAAVSHMWNLALELKAKPADTQLTSSFHKTFWEARMHYERLRLTASGQVQKEARYVLRYAYGLLREREGLPPTPGTLADYVVTDGGEGFLVSVALSRSLPTR
jgi:hypothetical protein